jgi:glycerol uptake facilitator-like aquaporin
VHTVGREVRRKMANRTTDRRVAVRGRPTSSGDQVRPDPRSPPLSQLWPHSAYEALLTTGLLFGVATAVRWVIGESPISRAVPGIHLQLLMVGVIVGLLLAGLILSPLGKASGGHLNRSCALSGSEYRVSGRPRTVLGCLGWRMVPVGRRGLPPWSRLPLSPAGTRRPWSRARPPAAPGVALRCWSSSQRRSHLPVTAPGGHARMFEYITRAWLRSQLLTISKAVMNPARQFGPAVFAGRFGFLATYLLAPLAGAVVAAWLLGRFQHRKVLTHRLYGRPNTDAAHDITP